MDKIRDELDLSTHTPSYKKYDGPVFEIFTLVSQAYVLSVIMKCKKTFSDLDPLPAVLFYKCMDIIVPHITNIFN